MQSDQISKENESTESLKPSNSKTTVEKTSQGPDACPLMAHEEHGPKGESVETLAKSFAVMSSSIEKNPEKKKSDSKKQKEELGKDILDSLADSKLKMLTFKVKSSEEQPPGVKREIEDYQLRKGISC